MSIKTKTTAAAALAALAVPAAAVAHGPGDHGKQGRDNAETKQARQDTRSDRRSGQAKQHGHRGHHGKGFAVKGVDAANLTVTDGKLAGPLTLDPTSANKHARRFLELTKDELRGEDTVTFGEAGDEVRIRYVGLQSTDALQPTDTVKVIGKVKKQRKDDATATTATTAERKLDIKYIVVKRGETAKQDDAAAKQRDGAAKQGS